MIAKTAEFYLWQMRRSASLALGYVEVMDEQTFVQDSKTQQAVALNLLVIGEAASKLLAEFPEVADRLSAVPWRSMKGMRNRIAHGYFDVDVAVIWDTARNALPSILAALPSDSGVGEP